MIQSLTLIRTELLQQHEDLRAKMALTRAAAERCVAGESAHAELNVCIERLAQALAHHNGREDELLRAIIPTLDAWGPGRAEIMSDAHASEHAEAHRALIEAFASPDARAAATSALRLLERISTHMQAEGGDSSEPIS